MPIQGLHPFITSVPPAWLQLHSIAVSQHSAFLAFSCAHSVPHPGHAHVHPLCLLWILGPLCAPDISTRHPQHLLAAVSVLSIYKSCRSRSEGYLALPAGLCMLASFASELQLPNSSSDISWLVHIAHPQRTWRGCVDTHGGLLDWSSWYIGQQEIQGAKPRAVNR